MERKLFISLYILLLSIFWITKVSAQDGIDTSAYADITAEIVACGESGDFESTRELCFKYISPEMNNLQQAYLYRYIMLTYIAENVEDSITKYAYILDNFMPGISNYKDSRAIQIIRDVGTVFHMTDDNFNPNIYYAHFFPKIDTTDDNGKIHYASLLVGLYLHEEPYEYQNHWYDNINQIKKSLELLESVYGERDTLVADRYYDLAYAYNEVNQYVKAIENYKISYEIYQKKTKAQENDLALIFNNIGSCYAALGLYHKAIENVRNASQLWKSIDNTSDYYVSIGNMSLYNNSLGYHEEAMILNEELNAYYLDRGDTNKYIITLLNQYYFADKPKIQDSILAIADSIMTEYSTPTLSLYRSSKLVNNIQKHTYLDIELWPIFNNEEDKKAYDQLIGKMNDIYHNHDLDSEGSEILFLMRNVYFYDGTLIHEIENKLKIAIENQKSYIGDHISIDNNLNQIATLLSLTVAHYIKTKNTKELELTTETIRYVLTQLNVDFQIEELHETEINYYQAFLLSIYASAINELSKIQETQHTKNIDELYYILAYVEYYHINYRALKPTYQRLLPLVTNIFQDYIQHHRKSLSNAHEHLRKIMYIYSSSRYSNVNILAQFDKPILKEKYFELLQTKARRNNLFKQLKIVENDSIASDDIQTLIRNTYQTEELLLNDLEGSNNLLYNPISLNQSLLENNTKVNDYAIIQIFQYVDSIYILGFVDEEYLIHSVPVKQFDQLYESYIQIFNLDNMIQINSDSLKIKTHNNLLNLYTLLIEPLRELLNSKKEWLIIPDGKLFNLPFHIFLQTKQLDLDYAEWEYLFKNKMISYAYSWDNLQTTLDESLNQKKMAVVSFGNERLEQDLLLKNTKIEAKNILKEVGGDSYHDLDISGDSIFKIIDPYDIVHISTHGIIEDNRYHTINLLLNPENEKKISLSDIYSHSYNQELISLGACNSGFTLDYDGEQVSSSIGRAFVNGGAESVLMALWEIPDNSTEFMMTRFYRNLKTGKSKSGALTSAYQEYLNSTQGKMHPYYWAAFTINGNNMPIIQDENKITPLTWIIVSLLIIILSSLLLRIKSI